MKPNNPVSINLFYLARLSGASGFAIFVFSLLINSLMLTGPLFMLQVYDRVLASGSVPTLAALFGLVLVLYLLFGILDYVRSRIMLQIANKLDLKIRDEAFEAIGNHAVKGDPNVRSLPLSDLNKVRQFLSSQSPFAFLDAPWAPIYLSAIYLLHPMLGLAALGATIILVIIAAANNYFTKRAVTLAGMNSAKAVANIEEFRNNAEVTMALGMLPSIRKRWTEIHDKAITAFASSSNISGILASLSKSLKLVFQSGILGLGAYLAIQQSITPGTMIAGSILMSRALAGIDQLIGSWQNYLTYRLSCHRLSSMLSNKPPKNNEFQLPKPKGNVAVKGVTYRLPSQKKPILMNINFKLNPGDGLGVIGPAGSGKTSLVRILVGISGEYIGNVKIDGAEINQYPIDELGKYIGYLPQDVNLFQGTVAENIARMAQDFDHEAVVNAARLANVHELVKGLQNGYETLLLEGGKNLSTGQRQRIGLARALYGNPVLVVLDEPNANLDKEGEVEFVKSMNTLRAQGTTLVIVAHHPSGLVAVNKVLALNNGIQLDFGNRQDVFSKMANMPPSKDTPTSPVRRKPNISVSATMNPFAMVPHVDDKK